MNYYPHHIGDFNLATRHLTRIEKSIYRDLLELYYDQEAPLPNNVDQLARLTLAQAEDEKTAIRTVLNEYFFLDGNAWQQTRCDLIIQNYQEQQAKNNEKKKSSNERKVKSRERRKELFEKLKTFGIVPAWNATIEQLVTELSLVTSEGCHGIVTAKPKPKPEPKPDKTLVQASLNADEFERLFLLFWISGINKANKEGAKKSFKKALLKKRPDEHELFVNFLVQDVQKRIKNEQLGFGNMLPTTYLNGERWNDQLNLKPKKLLALPVDDSKLWEFAKRHGLPNPARMTNFEYRVHLKNHIEQNKIVEI